MKLKVLTSDHCPPCQKLKEALEANPPQGYEVTVLRVEDDDEADEILALAERYRLSHLPIAVREDGVVCELRVEGGRVEVDCRPDGIDPDIPHEE